MLRRILTVLLPLITQLSICIGPALGQSNPLSAARTIGVYRPVTGEWIVNSAGNHTYLGGTNDVVFAFGSSGDTPVVGKWNGAALAIGVFDCGTWYLDWNNSQGWESGVDQTFSFGGCGDIPVVGDWNHDGNLRIGVVRPSANFAWYVQTGCSNGANVCDFVNGTSASFYWGQPGDVPVIGDWDQTNHLRVGYVRSGVWVVNLSTGQGNVAGYNGWTGSNYTTYSFAGSGNGASVVGDWGYGYLSVGTFNSGLGTWNVVNSSFAPVPSSPWYYGGSADIPVVGPWFVAAKEYIRLNGRVIALESH